MAAADQLDAAFDAAAAGDDVEWLTRLLDAHPHLMEATRGIAHMTLLMEAVEYGAMDVARLLLERGADVNARDDDGDTALYWASRNGHEELVALLLSHGADVINKGMGDWTALMTASDWGHLGVVRMLLQHMRGVGLNERSTSGRTALCIACGRGRQEVARALLLAGADHTIANNEGQTPLQTSRKRGHQLCEELIEVSTCASICTISTRAYVDRTEVYWMRLVCGTVSCSPLLATGGSGGRVSWSVAM
jgi:ankyrin repeat protein